jgi:hypothetical protein
MASGTLTCIIHASGFGPMQGVESPRHSHLLRGFRHVADAQKLAHPETMNNNKTF